MTDCRALSAADLPSDAFATGLAETDLVAWGCADEDLPFGFEEDFATALETGLAGAFGAGADAAFFAEAVGAATLVATGLDFSLFAVAVFREAPDSVLTAAALGGVALLLVLFLATFFPAAILYAPSR